jgi:hypothetical protein
MFAITIEHAVTNPILRVSGAELTAAGCASVVISGEKFYSVSTPESQGPNSGIEPKCSESINLMFEDVQRSMFCTFA